MKFLLFFLAVLLVGCAQVKMTGTRQTVVTAVGGVTVAMPLAEKECAKDNRHARFAAYGASRMEHIFDCVE